MKKVALISILIFLGITMIFAQSPQAFKYQAVLRNAQGEIRQNESVVVKIEIRKNSSSGTVVYSETYNTTTSNFGFVNLNVGTLNPSGFASIDWSNGPYFVKIYVDGSAMGSNQLFSVPYALFGEDEDANSSNELQFLTQTGYDITLSQGGGTVSIEDSDADPSNELQALSQTGNNVTLSQGGGTISVEDGDADPANEFQTLSITNNDLTIEPNGNTVTLPGGGGENLSQTLAIGNSTGSYNIDMNNKEIKNASRLDLENQDSYLDMYYGKIKDYWGDYGNSGQVLKCGSSSSHYIEWENVSDNVSGIENINCVERTSNGPKQMYSLVSPENWVEDFGIGIINNGQCSINLQLDFLELITINQNHPLYVFITPNSKIEAYWVKKNNDSFILFAPKALENSRFDYRVVAKRKNYEDFRMEIIESAYNDYYLYPENLGVYPKNIYEKLNESNPKYETYEKYMIKELAMFEPNKLSPYNNKLPDNWKKIRTQAIDEIKKNSQEVKVRTQKEKEGEKLWYDEFGNIIPYEIIDTLKVLDFKMYTFEQAQQKRNQSYINKAIKRKNLKNNIEKKAVLDLDKKIIIE